MSWKTACFTAAAVAMGLGWANAQPTIQQAVAAMDSGQHGEARAMLDQLREGASPSDWSVIEFYAAKSLYLAKDFERFVGAIEAIAAERPNDPALDDLEMLRGLMLEQLEQYEDALALYRGFANRFPDSPYLQKLPERLAAAKSSLSLKLAKEALQRNRFEGFKRLREFAQEYQADPRTPGVLFLAAQSAHQMGLHDEALELLEWLSGVLPNPDSHEPSKALRAAILDARDFRKAFPAYFIDQDDARAVAEFGAWLAANPVSPWRPAVEFYQALARIRGGDVAFVDQLFEGWASTSRSAEQRHALIVHAFPVMLAAPELQKHFPILERSLAEHEEAGLPENLLIIRDLIHNIQSGAIPAEAAALPYFDSISDSIGSPELLSAVTTAIRSIPYSVCDPSIEVVEYGQKLFITLQMFPFHIKNDMRPRVLALRESFDGVKQAFAHEAEFTNRLDLGKPIDSVGRLAAELLRNANHVTPDSAYNGIVSVAAILTQNPHYWDLLYAVHTELALSHGNSWNPVGSLAAAKASATAPKLLRDIIELRGSLRKAIEGDHAALRDTSKSLVERSASPHTNRLLLAIEISSILGNQTASSTVTGHVAAASDVGSRPWVLSNQIVARDLYNNGDHDAARHLLASIWDAAAYEAIAMNYDRRDTLMLYAFAIKGERPIDSLQGFRHRLAISFPDATPAMIDYSISTLQRTQQ